MIPCVFCGQPCDPAPTKEGWTRIDREKGLHFHCAQKVVDNGKAIAEIENPAGDSKKTVFKKNQALLEIEIEALDGKIYKQPDCRIKTSAEGNVLCLIRKDGHWEGIKGKLTIKGFKLIKIYYSSFHKKRIPVWLIKIFGVNI